MTKPPYQINSSLRKNYPAHHPQESGGGMVDDVVPISLGGTGATTAEGARDNLGTNDASNLTTGTLPNARVSNSLTPDKAFRRGNILGTVSQSGGVPTGAVIERGSNANGQYVRFADGTQICWMTAGGIVTDIALGPIFRSAQVTVTYPAVFAEIPSVYVAPRSSPRWGGITANTTSSQCQVQVFSTASSPSQIPTHVAAIGRWF